MIHVATPQFWDMYKRLPADVRELADKNFQLLKANPKHPSLHYKKIDGLWSVRIGRKFRALGLAKPKGTIWFWIGTHKDYERLLP